MCRSSFARAVPLRPEVRSLSQSLSSKAYLSSGLFVSPPFSTMFVVVLGRWARHSRSGGFRVLLRCNGLAGPRLFKKSPLSRSARSMSSILSSVRSWFMLALKGRSLVVLSVVVIQALGVSGLSSWLFSVPSVLISVRCPKTMPLCNKYWSVF